MNKRSSITDDFQVEFYAIEISAIKLTHVGFRAHVIIAPRIVS